MRAKRRFEVMTSFLSSDAQKAVNGGVRRKKLCVGDMTTGVRMSCAG